MAAFNFPNSPSTNDLHTENGVTFKWNGTIWLRVGNSYSDISTLNVSGIGTFGGDLSIADKIVHTGDTNTALRFPAADTITAETGGAERVRITSAGNVGIGNRTTSPNSNLHVHTASGDCTARVEAGSHSRLRLTAHNGASIVEFGDAGSDAIGKLQYTHSNDQFDIRVNGSDRITVSSAGNVWFKNGSYVSFNDNGYIRTDSSGYLRLQMGSNGTMFTNSSNSELARIDTSGRLLIGSTTKAGDSALQVYTSDRKHPAIRAHSPNANGFTILSDAYTADESNLNLGLAYSSASVVLGFGCKPSDSADNAFLSSQDTYSTRPCALKMGTEGDLRFYTTETSATTTTDSAVSLTEVFSIDRVGNIRQKVSSRYMYFGANQELQVGVNGSDPYVNAASGDLMIRDAGNAICNVRSDGLQMYQDIYFATSGKGIVLGATSNVDANTLDDYEEGSFTPVFNGSDGGGTSRSGTGKYTKVGNVVNCWVDLSNANGSGFGSGFMKVTGLPFTCTQQSWTTNIWTYNVAFNTSRIPLFYMSSGGTAINGYYSQNDGTWQPWYISEWDATQLYARFHITYLA